MAKKLTRAMEIQPISEQEQEAAVLAAAPPASEIRVIDGRKALVKTLPSGDVEIAWLT